VSIGKPEHLQDMSTLRGKELTENENFNYNPADDTYLKRKATGKDGSTEVINARFPSWTRKALGFEFGDDGSGDDNVGGILDCIAMSNLRTCYPLKTLTYAVAKFEADIYIQLEIAKDGRGAGFVPRENGLLRIVGPVASRSEATPENIIKSMREIFSPYELNITRVDWCSIFGSCRRVLSSTSKHSCTFIVRDALHVHLPRAGINMNFSIQDGEYFSAMIQNASLTCFSI
jgi:phenol 2-monooxygenase